MDLTDTFHYEGWTIKFAISKPENPSQTKTIVFVHGTPWSSVVFGPIVKALLATKQYRVVIYDLPGYGQSQAHQPDHADTTGESKFSGDTSIKTQAGALAALLNHLNHDTEEEAPPAVVAHDIAGAIVLRTHLIHGCKFRSLLLLDTNAILPWGDGFYKLVRAEPVVFLKLPPGIFEAVVRAVIRSACFNPKTLLSGWEDKLAEPWISTPTEDLTTGEKKQRSFVRQIAQADDSDVAEMLDQNLYEKVSCDVKIIWGENDQWIPKEKMDSLATKLQHRLKDFVVIPEAGHLVMIDQPERVTLETLTWLAEH